MIDGIKILSLAANRDSFCDNPLIEPHIPPTNRKTGEVKNEPEQAEYRGLKFSFHPNRIELNGSLHTFYNEGFHNYNDFHFRKLESVILELKHDLGIAPDKSVLNNMEIGVNIVLPFTPDRFLNQIIMHRGTPFTWQHDKTKRYRECSHTQFFIKSYNKGIQHQLNRYILRFELKYIKMERINQLGIKTLLDLIKPGNLEQLGKLVIKSFDEVLIGNLQVNYNQLNQRDRELFIQGHNEKYWMGLKPTDSTAPDYKKEYKRYERKLKRFNELLERTRANQQKKEIRELIIQKIDELCSPEKTGETDRNSLTENKGKLTGKPEQKKRGKLTAPKKTKTGENDTLLYSVKMRHQPTPKNQKCFVTGLDIFNQKKGSKFLSKKTIREIYFQNPATFKKLLKQFGSKRPYTTNEKQCYYIAHNIRNQYFRMQKKNTPGG
jgi:hypothetical protein